jgi:hypothetical protein
VDGIEKNAAAAAVAARVWANEDPGLERAANARCYAANKAGAVRGLLTATGARPGIVSPDGLAMRGLPCRDVIAMAFRMREPPGVRAPRLTVPA